MYRDPLLQELATEEVRPGATYFSPAHLMNYQKHWSGTPYWMQPGGIPYGQMYTDTFSAPAQPYLQGFTATVVEPTAVYGSGQAPTNGIYTGVEDVCNG